MFQSTLPVKGATVGNRILIAQDSQFQSTLPVKGATLPIFRKNYPPSRFNPRSQ